MLMNECKCGKLEFSSFFAVLMRFRDAHGRDPETKTKDEDLNTLIELRKQVLADINVNGKYLEEDFAR